MRNLEITFTCRDIPVTFAIDAPDDHIQRHLATQRSFYEDAMLLDSLQRLTEPGAVVDVGAHIGNHSIFYAAIGRRPVVAIEPHPENHARLLRNVALNGLQDRIQCLPQAAGAAHGKGRMILHDIHNSGKAVLATEGSARDVDIIPLDDVAFPQPPALIKIDVEGMEYDVLQGASRILQEYAPLLYIEISDMGNYRRIAEFLAGYGYHSGPAFNHTPTFLFMPNASPAGTGNTTEAFRHAYAEVTMAQMRLRQWLHRRQTEHERQSSLSVIIATRNHADVIARTLESLSRQTHPAQEIIVVDDASEDVTCDIIEAYAQQNRRIRLFRLWERRGPGWCRNYGIAMAEGAYIALQGAGDLALPERFARQHAVLRQHPQVPVVTCGHGTKGADGRLEPVVDTGHAPYIRSMMIRKSFLHDRAGYFDAVPPTLAEAEFAERLHHLLAPAQSHHLPDMLYVALTQPEKAPFSLAALRYRWHYRRWHRQLKRPDDACPPPSFPSSRRPFAIPARLCTYSTPTDRHPVCGSIASFPPREAGLRQVVAAVLPQVDRLYVYLNEYGDIPDFLRHPRIIVARSQEHDGDLMDNGKFFFLEQMPRGYHFTFDDDIAYPPDYVQRLTLKLQLYRNQAVIGVHGAVFHTPFARFYQDRDVHLFWEGLAQDKTVHILGSGTLAYHRDALRLAREDFRSTGMADIWLAITAKQQHVPLIAMQREPGWLRQIPQADEQLSLYARFRDDDTRQTGQILYEGPWEFSAQAQSYAPLARYFAGIPHGALRSHGINAAWWERFAPAMPAGKPVD